MANAGDVARTPRDSSWRRQSICLSNPLTTTANGLTASNGQLGALENCVVTVPVAAPATGTVTLSSASFQNLIGLQNTVGTQQLSVEAAPVWETNNIVRFKVS